MKLAIAVAAALFLLLAGIASGNDDLGVRLDFGARKALKDAQVFGTPHPQPRQGGEDISSATVVPDLPYYDAGNTCGYLDDYDEVCPYSGSTSPDVVYQYIPAWDDIVQIDLCASLYDTKLYVYENTVDNLVACNDDACGDDGYRSLLTDVPMTGGNTYYIVVDGYGGDCGEYEMRIETCPCCVVECPPAGIVEGEPPCGTNYEDTFNAGCTSDPPVFQDVPCSTSGDPITICGESGGFSYYGLDYRDTDWYAVRAELNPDGLVAVLETEISTFFAVIEPVCDPITIVESVYVPACVPMELHVPAEGDYWIVVASDGFGPGIGCGHDYTLTITGYECGPVSVEPASWANMKGAYR
jgi:hypothetical protein